MPPVSVHLKPKTGKEITLDDLRELVEKAKGVPGKSPILVTVVNSSRPAKVSLLNIDIAD
ncbi:hypothetical protein [Streptomyces sp. JH34]|uniref:hypothetical protein n=1 Tax=Streptomyces sp. JH34 TaxID=2793633 RepID=UPI0023F8D59E|nr:hypothetical protein [Streptomyces sp. JH34]MDF6020834.1 hypothetical protein [Streptomyces sp. JH34]